MRAPREPIFLARQSYRRRRLMDAARFMPFLGAFLLVAPVLWAGLSSTTFGIYYIFGCWVILIGVAAALSSRLARVREEELNDEADG